MFMFLCATKQVRKRIRPEKAQKEKVQTYAVAAGIYLLNSNEMHILELSAPLEVSQLFFSASSGTKGLT